MLALPLLQSALVLVNTRLVNRASTTTTSPPARSTQIGLRCRSGIAPASQPVGGFVIRQALGPRLDDLGALFSERVQRRSEPGYSTGDLDLLRNTGARARERR